MRFAATDSNAPKASGHALKTCALETPATSQIHSKMNPARLFLCLAAALMICLVGSGCARVEHRKNSGSAIQQVGLVWLKQAGDPTARQKVIDAVHEFGRSIPGIESATVGETDGIGGPYSDTSFDVCFILTFKDEASRQRYGKHPVHEKAAKEVFLPLSKKLLFYRFVPVRD